MRDFCVIQHSGKFSDSIGLKRGFRCSKPCQVLHINNSNGFWRDVAVLGRVSLTDA